VGPGANVEDGSSLIIHWSSGSHIRSTNWANQYDIYFSGAPTGGGQRPWPLDPSKSGSGSQRSPDPLAGLRCGPPESERKGEEKKGGDRSARRQWR